MKKCAVLLFFLLFLSAFLLSCGSEKEPPKAFTEMTLEEILSAIYQKGGYSKQLTELIEAPVPAPDSMDFSTYLVTTEIDADNCEYFLGSTEIEFERAIASEANISPTTYSLCLIQAKEGQDVNALASAVRKNANPMKWICTGLPGDAVYVDKAGDIVILIMSATDGDALLEAFRSLAESPNET